MSRPRDERAGTGQPRQVIANGEVYYSDRDHAMIRRSPRPSDQFTVIRNDVLRDSRLSFRARGLLASILSRPDNWTARVSQLVNEGKEGREAIRAAMDELKFYGYLHISQYRDERGQFVTDQVVYDEPRLPKDHEKPVTGKPYTGNREAENRDTDSWEVLEELSRTTEKKQRKEEQKSLTLVSCETKFDEFWSIYPKRVGKGKARQKWNQAIRKSSPDVIIEGARRYAEQRAGQDPYYTAHPSSWLNGERWLDEPDPEFRQKGNRRDEFDVLFEEATQHVYGRKELGA